jgi:ethanolamine ammonia-lyase small subunit
MKPPDKPTLRAEIAAMTEARLTLGARGRALDTAAALRFALDHARAREAVWRSSTRPG